MVLKFMDNIKNDSYYFSKSIDDIEAIKVYLNNETYEEFLSDGKTDYTTVCETITNDLDVLKDLFEKYI